jgi:thiamine-phosphate pyrophosphorylase
MQLYAITNSANIASTLEGRIEALRRLASSWADGGVEYLQIREKDLGTGELEHLASAVIREVEGSRTRVLVNGRVDIALAVGAHGVHLPGNQRLLPSGVRQLFARGGQKQPMISIPCHSLDEAKAAKKMDATLILFAPVFEKLIPGGQLPGKGLDELSTVCSTVSPLPVFALGGVNKENAHECAASGARGIAAIRLFQTEEWKQLCCQ